MLEQVIADLEAEGLAVEALVSPLTAAGWRRPTPAEGWDIATTISHLAWTDEVAILAATDKAKWDEVVMDAINDPAGFVDTAAAEGAQVDPRLLLERWQASRPALAQVLRDFPEGGKVRWFGPPMAPASMATARLMETWAHGLDIAEALGVHVEPTDRIRHVASIGFRTRDYSFANVGLEAPAEQFRLELTSPSGDVWTFGPDDAPQAVTGSAYDFCALVTQRLHRADTDLVAVGPDADTWLDIAQCFAGPAGGGREPKRGIA
ncbi:TIGR03084 family protein [Nocardioides gansuensis]|uniref:TIGR03084 family protein n=1 Tax=Nocardioides gansuensis TaxID=2138300 RepID=A0A2T8FGK7_9ACTN|nr:TIGR03084 family protein [Nocardioides gansuensis]